MSLVSPADFDLLAQILKQRSGLTLTVEKGYLLESRLTPLARKRGFPSITELVQDLRTNPTQPLLTAITEAMTTNESFFFRDTTPFTQLRDVVLPALREARQDSKSLRIWCAAASTGQEPYSIAMVLDEQKELWQDWSIEIVGSDLAEHVLTRARAGVYSQFEVQRGLPVQYLLKYFEKDGEQWRVKPDVRRFVSYKMFNLLDPMMDMGQFDIIFCRNVMIYFDAPTKTKVLEGMAGQIAKDGVLFLGAAETVVGLTKSFRVAPQQRGLYVPVDSAAVAKRLSA